MRIDVDKLWNALVRVACPPAPLTEVTSIVLINKEHIKLALKQLEKDNE